MSLALLIVLSIALFLSACEKTPGTSTTTGRQGCEQHTEQTVAGKEATCTEKGLTDGKICSVCGEVLTVQEEIPALGHDEVTDAAVDATCVETGLTEGKHCSRCNEVLTAREEIPALGHDKVTDAAVDPTCTTEGKTEGEHCSRCDEIFTAQKSIDALGHDWSDWVETKTATTEAAGEEERICNRADCEGKETREIPKLSANEPNGHVWDEGVVTKEPTCTETGTKSFKCTNEYCTATKDESINALGHDRVTDAAEEPSCLTGGKTEGEHCARCNEVIVAQKTLDALGHDEVIDEAVAVSCATNGKTEGKHCSRCKKVLIAQEEIPATGHSYGEWTVGKEPTLLEDGYRSRICANCQDEDVEVLEALKGTYACICQGKSDNYDLTLIINDDGTATLTDGEERYSAENAELTAGMISDYNGGTISGYKFSCYDSESYTIDVNFYFLEDGTIKIDLTGTFIPMVKKAAAVSFTESQQGTYTGDYYGWTRKITVNDDGTVTFVYGYRKNTSSMDEKLKTIENITVSQCDAGYGFIYSDLGDNDFPALVTFRFAEDGKLLVNEAGEQYELTRG